MREYAGLSALDFDSLRYNTVRLRGTNPAAVQVTSGRFGAVVDGSKRTTAPQKQGIEPDRNEVMKEAWDDECMMNKQSQKVNSPKPILENWRLAKRSHDPDLAAPERFSGPFRRFLGVPK
jgi:hypothetical protein